MILPVKKKILIIGLSALLVVAILVPSLIFGLKTQDEPSGKGAVVANGKECAKIGSDILKMKGSAIDAAIATLFCEGVTCPQSMGLGGGFVATIYIKSKREINTLIARETAPLQSTEDMFVNKTVTGGLSVAVPGELKGYWSLHKKYGKLPWKDLVGPTINLCREGHLVTEYLHSAMKKREHKILNSPSLKEILINPKTGHVWEYGDKIKRLKLAETLEIIAKEGEDSIYGGGNIGKMLAEDIQNFGGIITEKDLQEYQVKWTDSVSTAIRGGFTLYTTPLPSSGNVLSLMLNLMEGLYQTNNSVVLWHRVIESFKHAYGIRTHLGDIDFLPEIKTLVADISDPGYVSNIRKLIFDDRTFNDYNYYGANYSTLNDRGTANIAVLAPNGDAVVVTSTINNIFGSLLISQQTGIILNDEMDDFSIPGINNGFDIPPSPANFIRPKKRPLSSMCPSIILDHMGNVRLLIGAAGGSKITTSVASVIIKHLILGEPLKYAVAAKRLHHQLAPMYIQYETGFNQSLLTGLHEIGHNLDRTSIESGFSSLTAVSLIENEPTPVFDPRRPGSVSVVSL